MIEVMIPFPFVFLDVDDDVWRRKKKRADQRSLSQEQVYISRGCIVFLVSQHFVGSLFNLSKLYPIDQNQEKEDTTKHFTNGFAEATKDGLLWRAALDITHLKLIQYDKISISIR